MYLLLHDFIILEQGILQDKVAINRKVRLKLALEFGKVESFPEVDGIDIV